MKAQCRQILVSRRWGLANGHSAKYYIPSTVVVNSGLNVSEILDSKRKLHDPGKRLLSNFEPCKNNHSFFSGDIQPSDGAIFISALQAQIIECRKCAGKNMAKSTKGHHSGGVCALAGLPNNFSIVLFTFFFSRESMELEHVELRLPRGATAKRIDKFEESSVCNG